MRCTSLAQRHTLPLAIPILIALVLGAVVTGQYQTSFEVIIDAPLFSFSNTGPDPLPDHDTSIIPNPYSASPKPICTVQKIDEEDHYFESTPLSSHGSPREVVVDCEVQLPHNDQLPDTSNEWQTIHHSVVGHIDMQVMKDGAPPLLLDCKTAPQSEFSANQVHIDTGTMAKLEKLSCDELQETLSQRQLYSTVGPLKTLAQRQVLSIWGSIHELFELNEHLLSYVLLAFSGVWPIVKQVFFLVLWVTPLPQPMSHGLLIAADIVGKWSMVDVLFVGLLMTVLKLDISMVNAHLKVVPHRGVYIYATAVIMSTALTVWMRHMAQSESHDVPAVCDIPDVEEGEAKDSDLESESSPEDTDVFFPSTAQPTPLWCDIILFLVAVAAAVLITLGLTLPICRVSRTVIIFQYRPTVVTDYSVFGMSWLMYKVHGDPILLFLQALFVCCIPLVKCWSTVLLWWIPTRQATATKASKDATCSMYRWRVARILQPWQMCDVFLLTLVVLSLRVSSWVDDFAQGYAAITATPFHMPGFWCCFAGALLDGLLLVVQLCSL